MPLFNLMPSVFVAERTGTQAATDISTLNGTAPSWHPADWPPGAGKATRPPTNGLSQRLHSQEIRYTVAVDSKAWRKVHPPHLAAAVASGQAAIGAHLEAVSPYPYSVAEVETHAAYSNVMWSTDTDDGDPEDGA